MIIAPSWTPHAARSEVRRRRRRPWDVPVRTPPEAIPATQAGGAERAPDVAHAVIADLDAQAVSPCLASLPDPQRICIVLMDVAGYAARETAEALGYPRGTVRARVHLNGLSLTVAMARHRSW